MNTIDMRATGSSYEVHWRLDVTLTDRSKAARLLTASKRPLVDAAAKFGSPPEVTKSASRPKQTSPHRCDTTVVARLADFRYRFSLLALSEVR